jgi:hypothetical protein
LKAAVTYENTTKDFAAAVVAADSQGLRICYYSLASDKRTIGIVPWELEPGATYRLVYGIDPDNEIASEITTFNNVAQRRLSEQEVNAEPPTAEPADTPLPRGRGRGR